MTIYEKLLEVQKEIGAIKKDSTNPFFKSKYFDINSLLAEVKPVLNKHGLLLLQALDNGSLTTVIVEASTGDKISYGTAIPMGTDAQKAGSVITYFRRYALTSLLALEAEDDDAQSTKTPPVQKNVLTPKAPTTNPNSFAI